MELNNSTLHHVIIDILLTRGWAPSAEELTERFGVSREEMRRAMNSLAEYHGVVTHPGSDEIWVVHPFSTAPTNFLVRSGELDWWGSCIWCSLGLVSLAGETGAITTALGAAGRQVTVRIEDGQLIDQEYVVHFPIKVAKIWDNVVYGCSMMLLFENETEVDDWCGQRGKVKGDVRPLTQVWPFAREWYARHHDPNWVKWTVDEASALFERHGLTGPIWEMPKGSERF